LKTLKYFFYITNHTDYCAEKIVALANERCDQENVIEQLKNGVNAMRMPVDDLLSNWCRRDCLNMPAGVIGLNMFKLVRGDSLIAKRSQVTLFDTPVRS
jgi:hypothetical protein